MIRLPWLDSECLDPFPPVATALAEPDGLLAAGGDLRPERLLDASRHGIFPWCSAGQPILWWSPARRSVFDTAQPHVPRRLRRWLRGCDWSIRVDTAFGQVIEACAAPRARERGTWITPAMVTAYVRLHELGHAHALEVWDGATLVGGIYGVALGRMFFGESMFSRRSNASKLALLALCAGLHEWDFPLLDAQIASPHLATLGARELPRDAFCSEVARLAVPPGRVGSWREAFACHRPAALAAMGGSRR